MSGAFHRYRQSFLFLFLLLVAGGVFDPAFSQNSPSKRDQARAQLKETGEWLKAKVSFCQKLIRAGTQFINPIETALHAPFEKGVLPKIGRGVNDLATMGEVFISPLPVSLVPSPTRSIFRKLWKDPAYQPTAEERAVLERYKAGAAYDQKQKFMQKWKKWVWFQRAVVAARRIALSASLLLAANHALQVGAAPIDRKTYFDSPAYQLGPQQIQLINESVPFPHTAIRMGEKVYSYGFTHLTAKPVRDYLMTRDEFAKRFVAEAKKEGRDSSAAVTEMIGKQLQKLPRSVQVVTLNLSAEEYSRLKRDLELSTANRYLNVTCVHDCTTMAFQNLDENTSMTSSRFIDASPAQTFFVMSLLETLGSNRVQDVYQVAIDLPAGASTTSASTFASHTLRNFGITVMESKFFIELLPFNQAQRLWIDLRKGPEQREFKDEFVLAEIKSWKADVEAEFADSPQWRVFDRLSLHAVDLTPREREETLVKIEEHVALVAAQWKSELESSETDFKDIILNEYRLEILKAKLAEYRQRLHP